MKKLIILVLLLASSLYASEKTEKTPVELKPAQVARLTEAQNKVSQAQVTLAAVQAQLDAAKKGFEAEVLHVALELKLDLDTHSLDLMELGEKGSGRFAFTPK